MFGIDSGELLLIVIITIVVVGPKELPRVLYKIGQVMGKIRGVTQHFRTGIDAMVREVELEELEKKWAADNKRIMAQNPEVYDAESLVGTADYVPSAGDEPAPEAEVTGHEVEIESLDDERKSRPEAAE
jgi:sec-independent protein translocase protein TatB